MFLLHIQLLVSRLSVCFICFLLIKPDKYILEKERCIVHLFLNLIQYGMFFGERTTIMNKWEN